MRIVFTILLWGVGLVLVTASAGINAIFWNTQGGTAIAGQMLAIVSVGTDFSKSLLPLLIDKALAARRVVVAMLGAIAFIVFLIASLVASIGFFALNRSTVTGSAEAIIAQHKLASQELKDLESQLAVLPRYHSISELRATIAAMKHQWRWKSSKGCTDATTAKSRTFCSQYQTAVGQLGGAVARDRLEIRQAKLRAEVIRLTKAGGAETSDPQASAISRLLRLVSPDATVSNVQYMLIVFAAVLVEVGAAFTLFFAARFPAIHRDADASRDAQNCAAASEASNNVMRMIDVTPEAITDDDVAELLQLPPALQVKRSLR